MADVNASSDYLPQISRDRADSNMSFGPAITLTDNGGEPSTDAGPPDSPVTAGPPNTTPPATDGRTMASPEDEKLVQDVLTSEVNTGRIRGHETSNRRTDGPIRSALLPC